MIGSKTSLVSWGKVLAFESRHDWDWEVEPYFYLSRYRGKGLDLRSIRALSSSPFLKKPQEEGFKVDSIVNSWSLER